MIHICIGEQRTEPGLFMCDNIIRILHSTEILSMLRCLLYDADIWTENKGNVADLHTRTPPCQLWNIRLIVENIFEFILYNYSRS